MNGKNGSARAGRMMLVVSQDVVQIISKTNRKQMTAIILKSKTVNQGYRALAPPRMNSSRPHKPCTSRNHEAFPSPRTRGTTTQPLGLGACGVHTRRTAMQEAC